MRQLTHSKRTPGEICPQVEEINGIVHPFTDQPHDYVDLMGKAARYSDLIREVAEDKGRVLIFIGTMPEDTLDALKHLDEPAAKRLSEGLTDMSDTGRDALRRELKLKGVRIKTDARYTILDELSLLCKAVSSIEPERLIYFEDDVDSARLRRRLGGRVDASTVSVSFTGEKPNVCVKDRGSQVCDALSIPRQRLNIT
ncbi:MAG: hypothetical protein ABH834_00045 [Candidatus Altiarchaeota archaeon]